MIVNSVDKFPVQRELYVIITSESISVPGDERSRDAPGHGYPAHTANHLGMDVFETEEDFLAAAKTMLLSRRGYAKPFLTYKMTPLEVVTEMAVKVV